MHKSKWFGLLMMGFIFLGCGPDTIFVRPALDTPSQHVANGNRLLERGKIDDACREFVRARELDPSYIQAYVGLGVALGRKGDIDAGMQTIDLAESMAGTANEREMIRKGYEQLRKMRRPEDDRP